MSTPGAACEILAFWFGPDSDPERDTMRAAWFRKDPAFDQAIASRFGLLIEQAIAGELDDWTLSPRGALANLILLDQFPRNIHRGLAGAFAGDGRALALARRVVSLGWDLGFMPVERVFVYLPFEHSEDPRDQDESVRRFEALRDDPRVGGTYDWALKHRAVIERFGRFPHRNEALGRPSTEAERVFLLEPGSRF